MLPIALMALAPAQAPSPIRLSTLPLTAIRQDFESPKANRSVDGNPLTIAGKVFEHGIGTHAVSEWAMALDRNGLSFRAMVGVDDETNQPGSVRFLVIGDAKTLADSGVMRSGQAAKELKVDLSGVRSLRLVVEDANDGINFDHANWAEATLVLKDAKKLPRFVLRAEPAMKIAAPDFKTTRIHGPRAVGCTAGREFIFRVPATGKAPLRFSAEGLPAGLNLDPATGVVTGRVGTAGAHPVKVSVSGPGGKDSRTITIDSRGLLALTPPMGWNSWNVWGLSVDDNKVRAAADSFVSTGLASFGYNFVNIDDGWESETRLPDGSIGTNSKFADMRALSTYVHSHGLKLGIYSSPGPRTCGGYLGSWQHEVQDAQTWADWGIDYLKHDWCSYSQISRGETLWELQNPYLTMKRALDASGRDIVYSLCQYGMGDVYKWGSMVGGNLWRTTGDITDTWGSMAGIGFDHSRRSPFVKPGGWNDPDMLVVGQLGWGPSIRPTKLKPNEQITHITLWAMLAAPLLIGCDLTKIDRFTASLLMNHDVIEVDQDPLGRAATKLMTKGIAEVWTRPLWDGTVAVALFNRGLEGGEVVLTTDEIGRSGTQPIRDLWRAKNLGKSRTFGGFVPGHGALLFRVGTMKD